MTDAPTPTEGLVLLGIALGVALGVAVGIWLLTRAIAHVAGETDDVRIVVVVLLTILTLTTVIGFAVTGLDDLGVLAGTGIGAIAGAVTSSYTRNGRNGDKVDESPDVR